MQKRFSEELIIGILKQQEQGIKVLDIIRQNNISEQTFYRWKSKYGGMEVAEARKLKLLADLMDLEFWISLIQWMQI